MNATTMDDAVISPTPLKASRGGGGGGLAPPHLDIGKGGVLGCGGGSPDTAETAPDSDDRSALLAEHRAPHHQQRGSPVAGGKYLNFNSPSNSPPASPKRFGFGRGGEKGSVPSKWLWTAAAIVAAGAAVFLVGYERGRAHELADTRDATTTSATTFDRLNAPPISSSNDDDDDDATDDVYLEDDDLLSNDNKLVQHEEDQQGHEHEHDAKRRRAFVCITGQLPRLELHNKISNLFRPLKDDYGLTIDVALILSDSDHASNHHTLEHESQEYYSIHEVVDALYPYADRILNTQLDIQAPHPIVPEVYFDQLGKKDRMTREEQRERVRNHVRQFESISKCHRWMVSTGREYEVVHRIRDDTGYYSPVNYTAVSHLLSQSPTSIVSSACAQHGGINDRGSFVTPLSAYDYFNHPIVHMYTQPIGRDIDNTEKFLKRTYDKTVENMAVLEDLFLMKFIAQDDEEKVKKEKKKKRLKGNKGGDDDDDDDDENRPPPKKGFYHKSDKDCIAKHGLKPDRGLLL